MKLPFSFDLKLVFRLLLPGFILGVALYPLVRTLISAVTARPIGTEVLLVPLTIVAGWSVIVMDMSIYMVFEGRRYWPSWLLKLGVRREERRLKALQQQIATGRLADRRRYLEAGVEMRRFPMDQDGAYRAKLPTRLGNLLAAYEGYSERIYGMDPPFYWSRLWLTLGKELREEIDGQQAMTDSATYTAAALLFSGALLALYGLLGLLRPGLVKSLPAPSVLGILAALSITSGYVLYRCSLHLHAQFGETFKSVFDLYRGNLRPLDDVMSEVTSLSQDVRLASDPKARYKAVWRYLHNYRIKIHGEGEAVAPPNCDAGPR